MASDWDWHSEDGKESTIIPRVDSVAVYTNNRGDAVIRQSSPLGDDDSVIVIPQGYLATLIDALKAVQE
jgi:hypothetical protein